MNALKKTQKNLRFRTKEKGAGLVELAIILPLFTLLFMASTDMSRLIYRHQQLTDLTREAANLVSRGGTPDEAFVAMEFAASEIDVSNNGAIIVSRIRRRTDTDPTPWVFEQVSNQTTAQYWSRVGGENGPAEIPNLSALEPGVIITSVEMQTPFAALFDLEQLGANFYPEDLYDAAFF